MDYKINSEERCRLRGIPHIQQLIYLVGLRPYMDYRTGDVGIARKVSYQSIREELYVEPHVGYKVVSLSRDQIKRALKGLERAGMIELRSLDKHLILKCLYATSDNSVQNKAAPKPPQKGAHTINQKTPEIMADNRFSSHQAARPESQQAAIPPVSVMYVCSPEKFFQFWEAYPEKRSQQAAEAVFTALSLTEASFNEMMNKLEAQKKFYTDERRKGNWVPRWKYPANWLREGCWNDELTSYSKEKTDEPKSNKRSPTSSGVDLLWESCRSDDDAKSNELVDDISNVVKLFKTTQ